LLIDKIDQQLEMLLVFPPLLQPQTGIENADIFNKHRSEPDVALPVSNYQLTVLLVFDSNADQSQVVL
jgi:hypothetical protein